MHDSPIFPPAETADAHGLVAWGEHVAADLVLDAYRNGIFPWPDSDGWIGWFSPDPRPLIELEQFHVPRRLLRTLRAGKFSVTFNTAFDQVIEACAAVGNRPRQAWLLPEMRAVYKQLHRLGHAHSVEVWHGGTLAGGVYGVAIGGAFHAESKFHVERDASKVALVHLVRQLRDRGYHLLDIQQRTRHMEQFGIVEVPRAEFLRRLFAVRDAAMRFLEGEE